MKEQFFTIKSHINAETLINLNHVIKVEAIFSGNRTELVFHMSDGSMLRSSDGTTDYEALLIVVYPEVFENAND